MPAIATEEVFQTVLPLIFFHFSRDRQVVAAAIDVYNLIDFALLIGVVPGTKGAHLGASVNL